MKQHIESDGGSGDGSEDFPRMMLQIFGISLVVAVAVLALGGAAVNYITHQ